MLVRKAYKNLTVIPLTFGSQRSKKYKSTTFWKIRVRGYDKVNKPNKYI